MMHGFKEAHQLYKWPTRRHTIPINCGYQTTNRLRVPVQEALNLIHIHTETQIISRCPWVRILIITVINKPFWLFRRFRICFHSNKFLQPDGSQCIKQMYCEYGKLFKFIPISMQNDIFYFVRCLATGK